jgi:hypothetical protein
MTVEIAVFLPHQIGNLALSDFRFIGFRGEPRSGGRHFEIIYK